MPSVDGAASNDGVGKICEFFRTARMRRDMCLDQREAGGLPIRRAEQRPGLRGEHSGFPKKLDDPSDSIWLEPRRCVDARFKQGIADSRGFSESAVSADSSA